LPLGARIAKVEVMKGDIAFAGFVLTADEWQALDIDSRTQLLAAATRRDDPWEVPPVIALLAEGSGPNEYEELVELEVDAEEIDA
jgi:hypothetical protein